MARNCGECLWNTQDVTPLPKNGICPKCGANYGPKPKPEPKSKGGK